MKIRSRATAPQTKLVNSTATFPAFVGGFGSGKSHALMLRALKMIFDPNETTNVAYYLPTYDLIKQIAYPRFIEMLDNLCVRYTVNKSDYTFEVNNKRLIMRTLDNPDRIVGYEVGDSLVDELDTLPTEKARDCWNKIIARNRQKKNHGKNTVAVGTTPEGYRFVYERWGKDPPPSYELIKAPTYSNKHIPSDYVDLLRETYTDQLLNAYIEGDFVNLTSGTVFANYDRVKCRSLETIQPGELLCIGMDFNVANMSAVVYVIRDGVWHAVDELTKVFDTPMMIQTIKGRYPDNKIRVYPDASGNSRKTVDASKSDISLLEQAGFMVYANKSNPLIKDRVLSANATFEKGTVKVNDNLCPEYARCLEQLAYDKNGNPDKASNLDHLPDAGTYPIAFEFPINRPVANLKVAFVR